jgi:hypothetical protein
MRMILMAAMGVVGAALLAPEAQAVPAMPAQVAPGGEVLVPVANGCGWNWHWVPGYRRWDGVWIPGHCARN